ncbi:MAG: TonB-dependent receptor, partial [Caulobacterales bacterium]|nr:TonB-dependent receptor [Caulobacterales bacterium]
AEDPLGTGDGTIFILGGAVSSFVAVQDANVFAGFGEATYDLTDKLRLTGGVRVTYEEKEFTRTNIIPEEEPYGGEESWTEPTWRGIADYQFTDDIFGYVSYSRGFRSGGFNGRAVSQESVGPYEPETVDSYEVGFRTEWFGNTVRVNPTAFAAQYKDKQEELLVGLPDGRTETTVFNASEARTWGFELEALARPTPNLDLRMAAGYLDYEYSDFLALDPRPGSPTEGQVIDITDTAELRRAPQWTFALGGDYVVPLDVGEITFTANYKYTDEFFAGSVFFAPEPRAIKPSTNVVDLALSLDIDRGRLGLPADLSLTAFGRDVFHDGPGRNGRPFDATPNFYFTNPEPARAWGVDLTLTR